MPWRTTSCSLDQLTHINNTNQNVQATPKTQLEKTSLGVGFLKMLESR
jgi:hypothetical protein